MCASGDNGDTLMINDVSRAYFDDPARKQVFVELPGEDSNVDKDTVGELSFSMYGTQDAAQNCICASFIRLFPISQPEQHHSGPQDQSTSLDVEQRMDLC